MPTIVILTVSIPSLFTDGTFSRLTWFSTFDRDDFGSYETSNRPVKVDFGNYEAAFCRAHSSVGKISDNMKNMWYIEFGREKMGEAKFQELKANAERLYIEICSPIPSDELLMFGATSGSNKDQSTIFPHNQVPSLLSEGRQQLIIGPFCLLYDCARVLRREAEEVVWIYATSTSYVHRLHAVPILFPPPMDDAHLKSPELILSHQPVDY
ncbi:hypothetical protein M9H77_09341 [Catharanthus roseus]|uniref:Uncharacterized protein n=1 Tax=Catharanthus roseus TaxID=4058 RepID=A0ACC0C0D7_CATRO|nr:hypothetical protein M9H77_09341 [Catharanthus roseus]